MTSREHKICRFTTVILRTAFLVSALLASMLIAKAAFPAEKYNLPMEYKCNGQTVYAVGAGICAQTTYPSYLRVKIPPTRGQLRVMDCNEDLTRDKNPDDFNTRIEKQGWWIFSRTVMALSDTPIFGLPDRSFDDCAIVASVAGEKTGIQTGLLIYESRPVSTFAEMSCGAQPNYKPIEGVALCKGLEGARLSIRSSKKIGSMQILGTTCRIQSQIDLSASNAASSTQPTSPVFETKIPEGNCVIDIRWVTADSIQLSRVLTIGAPRTTRELDSPLMVKEGDGVRIYKPIGSSLMSTEFYQGNKVVWRSGARDQESYTLTPSTDNTAGAKSWATDLVACHTAYSEELNSMSQMCYNLSNGKELSTYIFK